MTPGQLRVLRGRAARERAAGSRASIKAAISMYAPAAPPSPKRKASNKGSGSRGFYSNSARWRREAKAYLAQHPTCMCPDPLCNQRSVFVDHIQPIKDPTNFGDALIWDRGNWQALSRTCHFMKSRREQGEAGVLAPVKRPGPRIKGCDPATGYPLDPHHDWNKK